jgi:hypothetical protein
MGSNPAGRKSIVSCSVFISDIITFPLTPREIPLKRGENGHILRALFKGPINLNYKDGLKGFYLQAKNKKFIQIGSLGVFALRILSG